jgi:hypothetical protein
VQEVNPDQVRLPVRIASMVIAATFLLVAMLAGYRYIGWPPVIIVGGSGAAAFVLWSLTYLRRPLMPEVVLPAFLLTVAGLQVHWFLGAITPISNSMGQLTGRSLRGFTPVPCSKVWHGENERSATVSCI